MTPSSDEPARSTIRGRPSKREAMLLRTRVQEAALQEFRHRGYAGASIDGIARAAAVSRTTIYALYTDKATLFAEMIKGTVTATDIAGRVAFDDRPPRIILREALAVLNRAYYRHPNLEIIRLCIAEADRFPALFEEVRDILAATLDGLITYLERLHREGVVAVDNARRAALIFNMLSLGSLKPFFVHQDRLSSDDIDGHLDLALEIFLDGCLCPSSSAAGIDPK
jgi:TetR/AcrR family transcriptional repressor of mexJK operon